jgi:hypothetical protein
LALVGLRCIAAARFPFGMVPIARLQVPDRDDIRASRMSFSGSLT